MLKEILISVGKKDSDKKEPSEMDEESEYKGDEGKEAAAEDLLAAIKARDAAGVVEAFEALMEMCK